MAGIAGEEARGERGLVSAAKVLSDAFEIDAGAAVLVGIQDAERPGAKNTCPATHLGLLVIEHVPVESKARRINDVPIDLGGAAAGEIGGEYWIEERIVRENVGVDPEAGGNHQVRANLPFILKVTAEIEQTHFRDRDGARHGRDGHRVIARCAAFVVLCSGEEGRAAAGLAKIKCSKEIPKE